MVHVEFLSSSQGGGHPWQREQLRAGNVIDAMALVRRSAWEAVGGYSHIPGGWEDFDFWCKLIEADWHGVLYPQPLATYTQHGSSMLQSNYTVQSRGMTHYMITLNLATTYIINLNIYMNFTNN